MFDRLHPAPPDPILSLASIYRADLRPQKLDLGIGVFRDASGHTPIFDAVRKAERRLYEAETTKTYLSPAGDPGFCDAVSRLVLANAGADIAVGTVQTPGGAGALRILMGLVALAKPEARIWLPDPTWINHHAIAADAQLGTAAYPYLHAASSTLRFEAMCDALRGAEAGDVVLLHGCCHNPSGIDLSLPQMRAVANIMIERGLLPLVDLAYQGFGAGLDEDAAATRLLAGMMPEMMVAYSCSKNFGIYRERTGAAMLVSRKPKDVAAAASQLAVRARVGYSMPPDHGASIVRIILTDRDLAANWRAELENMRCSVRRARAALADEFRSRTGAHNFDFIRESKGMFSLLGITVDQATALRENHGIYIVPDGRMNLAGLPLPAIPQLVEAVLATDVRPKD